MIDATVFTVLVAKSIKPEVAKSLLDKAKIKSRFVKMVNAVKDNNTKEEVGFMTENMDLFRSSSPTTEVFDNKKTNPRAYSTSTLSDETVTCHYEIRLREKRIKYHWNHRQHCFSILLTSKQTCCESRLKILVPVNEMNQTSVDYRLYHLINKSQR